MRLPFKKEMRFQKLEYGGLSLTRFERVLKEEDKGSVLYNLAYETVKKVPRATFELYKHALSI